jgi:hypothetical protein
MIFLVSMYICAKKKKTFNLLNTTKVLEMINSNRESRDDGK